MLNFFTWVMFGLEKYQGKKKNGKKNNFLMFSFIMKNMKRKVKYN